MSTGRRSGWLLPSASLLLWGLASSAMIIINKHIMVDLGFSFPLLLTGLNQATSAVAGLAAFGAGLMPLRRPPSPAFMATRLLPVAACAAGTLYFGNLPYLTLSVAFIQILKVLTPAVTLAVAVAIGLERLTGPLVGSVALITAGTAIAAVMESSMGSFSWVGTSYFMLSLLLEAIRVVAIQLLLGQLRFNEAEILVFLGSPASLLLLLASFLLEHKRLAQAGGLLAAVRGSPAMFAASMTLGAMVNLSTALAIRTSSGLTFKVSGCVKNAFVVFYGIFTGDHVSSTQLLGYGVSVAGFAWYARNKQSQVPARAKRVD